MRRGLRWGLVALALGLLALAAAGAWAWRTEAGTRWLLARVPGLTVEAPQGRLTGGPFQAARLRWQQGGRTVEVEQLSWQDLRLVAWPHRGAWLRLEWQQPVARALSVQRAAAPAAPASGPPTDLRLPLEVVVQDLAIDRVQLDALPVLRALRADLDLGAERGSAHRIDHLAFEVNGIAVSGSGRIATDGDLALRADVQAGAAAPLPWELRAELRGPLARVDLRAALAAVPGAQAQLRATLAPFAPWPLTGLQATTQDLDLSTLSARLPRTRLGGQLTLEAPSAQQPVAGLVALVNALPGPWDAGRLPLRTLDARLEGRLDDRSRVDLSSFTAGVDGGRIEGRGRWTAQALALDLVLDTLRTDRLHTRAPALALSGPLALQWQGLPAPDGSAATAPPGAAVQARLDGRLAAGQRVHVAADLAAAWPAAGALQVQARRLELADGNGQARLVGEATRAADGHWHVAGRADVQRLDPTRWWPGLPKGAWQLDGGVDADLEGPWPPRPASLRGHASAELAPSRAAGVALQGQLRLVAGPLHTLQADLRAGANRLQADLRGTLQRLERGQLQLDAPALEALAPLLPGTPLAGRLRLVAEADGPWPALRTEAVLHGRALRMAGQSLDLLDASVHGGLAAHRVQLRAASAAAAPAWVPGAGGGALLLLDVDGGWQPAAGGGGRWRGRVGDLRLAPREGGAAAWVALDPVAAELELAPGARLRRVALAPGQASLLGATLRWQRAGWGDDGPSLDARLDPLPVAPWLQRLMPEAGWSGDLRVAARATVTAGAGFDADAVLERVDGDLALQREGRIQSAGLTALRLSLAAHGGTWLATQAATGRQLGLLAGSQTVRTAPAARWPAPDATLEGALTLQTPDLDVWSAWLPAGWRAGGSLQALAVLSGRAGAPQWRGRIDGTGLAIGNLLEGVDLHDGTLAVALDGDSARLERLQFLGGDGTLSATGSALFGDAPRAQLTLSAQRLQLLGRVDRRLVASGRAELALARSRLRVDGRFTVDEGLIDVSRGAAAALDADVVVVNRPGAAGAPAAAAPAARPGLDVDLQIGLGNALRLHGRGLDTRLAGDLRIGTADGRFTVDGLVRTVGGTYAAYGQNLSIERGAIRFAGEAGAPTLDILAVRPDIDTRVGVVVFGNAVNPRVRLYSEPDMSDLDRLSWLVLGRASGGLGTADTALLQRAALALLAGEKGGGTGGVVQRLGLDELSVGQSGSGDTRDTVVTLGKQINRRLFIAYERGLNAAAGSWQLIYRVAQRFTLRASSGEESALDAIFTWRW